jgi:hypothetical protein
MHKILISLFIFTSLYQPVFAQVSVKDIVFERKTVDLGVIYTESGINSTTFKFTNLGTKDFEIKDMEVACGCTTPKASKQKFTPGESGDIIVHFDPKGIVGTVDKWVKVRGNFSDEIDIELRFTAEIKVFSDRDPNQHYPGEFGYLVMDKIKYVWGTRYTKSIFYDTLRLHNEGYNDIIINDLVDLPSYIVPQQLPITIKIGTEGKLVLKIDLTQTDTIGPLSGQIKINTTDQFFKRKQLDYFLDVEVDYSKLKRKQLRQAPTISLNSPTVDMGTMKAGSVRSNEVIISNTGKSNLIIQRIDSECSCTALKPSKLQLGPGESIAVPIKFDSLFKSGMQYKTIKIYTNDPVNPIQRITVVANVN